MILTETAREWQEEEELKSGLTGIRVFFVDLLNDDSKSKLIKRSLWERIDAKLPPFFMDIKSPRFRFYEQEISYKQSGEETTNLFKVKVEANLPKKSSKKVEKEPIRILIEGCGIRKRFILRDEVLKSSPYVVYRTGEESMRGGAEDCLGLIELIQYII